MKPNPAYVKARAASITARSEARIPADVPHLRDTKVGSTGATMRQHKPRGTWRQRGWSEVSPYYSTAITVDRRWDK